jgi:hypothetical protein
MRDGRSLEKGEKRVVRRIVYMGFAFISLCICWYGL